MKRILLVVSLFVLPHVVLGAMSPVVYERARSHASDVMLIKTSKVIKYRYRGNKTLVKAYAKVLRRYRSSNHMRSGKWIIIRYLTDSKRSFKILGPAPTPILRPDQVYKVYINRSRGGAYFTPAAGSHSFVPMNSRRRRYIVHKKRLHI